jgi:hypothetical protein
MLFLKITTDVWKKNFSARVKYFLLLESLASQTNEFGACPFQGGAVVNQAGRKLPSWPYGHPSRTPPAAGLRAPLASELC